MQMAIGEYKHHLHTEETKLKIGQSRKRNEPKRIQVKYQTVSDEVIIRNLPVQVCGYCSEGKYLPTRNIDRCPSCLRRKWHPWLDSIAPHNYTMIYYILGIITGLLLTFILIVIDLLLQKRAPQGIPQLVRKLQAKGEILEAENEDFENFINSLPTQWALF